MFAEIQAWVVCNYFRSWAMDIDSSTATASSAITSTGQAGSNESAATNRKEAADSDIERKEVEASATSDGVGERVDVQA